MMKGCGKTRWRASCLPSICGEKLLINFPTGSILSPGRMVESDIILLCPECSPNINKENKDGGM